MNPSPLSLRLVRTFARAAATGGFVLAAPVAALATPPEATRGTPPEATRGTPPAVAFVSAPLVEQIVSAALPLPLALPAPAGGRPAQVTIVEARVCGPDPRGRARLLIVAAEASAPPREPALVPADCRAPLPALGKRALAGNEALAVAALSATSTPGELRVALEEVALAGDTDRAGTGLRALAAKPTLPLVSLGPLRAGDELPPLGFALQALDGGLQALVASDGAPPVAGAAAAPRPSSGANAAVALPLPFVNALLDAQTKRAPLLVRVDPETIAVSDVRVARGGAGLLVTGVATPRSVRQPLRLSVELGGDDLRITQVRVDADQEDCGALGFLEKVGCGSRNAARAAAAQALGAALRERYGGKLARALIGAQAVRLPLDERAVELRGELVRLAASGAGIEAHVAAMPAATAARR